MNKKVMIIIGVLAVIAIASIVLIVISRNQSKNKTPGKITLNWWQPYDEKAELNSLIEQYQASHSNVTINYVHGDWQTPREYEQEVTDTLANNEGPDIWAIGNDWLPKDYKKLSPIPETVMSADEYKKTFFPVIVDDMTMQKDGQNRIYGFPFSIDTLVLIYNTDLYGMADINDPPTTWDKFVTNVTTLTKRDGNNITQAGAALGTVNVEHSFDDLSLLMLQNGTDMVSDNKKEAYLNGSKDVNSKVYYPGTSALKFYTDFSSPKKTAYTWNESMGSGLEQFISGKVATIFGYSSDIATIKKRAPNLRFAVALAPQVKEGDKIAYPYFWSQVVSANSKNQEAAWDFLKFCVNKDNLNQYIDNKKGAGQPVVSSEMEKAKVQEGLSQDVGPIAIQAAYAKGWYKGDPDKMEDIFLRMITATVGGQPAQEAINTAAKSATKVLSQTN